VVRRSKSFGQSGALELEAGKRVARKVWCLSVVHKSEASTLELVITSTSSHSPDFLNDLRTITKDNCCQKFGSSLLARVIIGHKEQIDVKKKHIEV
jgi:hypothetical protein